MLVCSLPLLQIINNYIPLYNFSMHNLIKRKRIKLNLNNLFVNLYLPWWIFNSRHSESIQCLAYNPVSLHLASCALSDFAFWSADVKAVQKYKVSGRITSCAWSENGQFLAIGLAIGAVSLRNKVSIVWITFFIIYKMLKLDIALNRKKI